MAESTKFEVNIIAGDQSIKTFHSKNDLLKWVELEISFWQRAMNIFAKQAPDNIDKYSRSIISECMLAFETYQVQKLRDLYEGLRMSIDRPFKGPDEDADFINNAKLFSDQRCFCSFSKRGKKLLDEVDNKPLKALFLFGYWNENCNFEDLLHSSQYIYGQDNITRNLPLKSLRIAMNEAHVEAYLFDNNTFEKSEIERKSFIKVRELAQNLINKLDEKLDEQTSKFNHLKENINEDFKKTNEEISTKIENKEKRASELIKQQKKILIDHRNNFEGDLKNLAEKYDLGFSMESPVKYWSSQFEMHKRNAENWGIVFGTLLPIIAFLSYCFLIVFLEFLEIHPTLLKAPYLLIFFITFPAFLAIWILRILSRNLLSSINHMHEAKHRAVMAETFLALMHRDLANPDDKILMLNALFQPLKSQADDGAPPNWYALLMEKAGK